MIVLALLTAWPENAHADFSAGVKAQEAGDYAKALAEWQPLAQAGDARAAYALGYMSFYGLGIAQSYEEAVKWYERAAALNNQDALFALGMAREIGVTGERDPAAAKSLYERAISAGPHAEAEFALGRLYYSGKGVERDGRKAVQWYRKAAEHGHAGAQFMLGAASESGFGGMPQSRGEAYAWYSLAAQADPKVLTGYDPSFDARLTLKAIKEGMSPADIRHGEHRARHLLAANLKRGQEKTTPPIECKCPR